MVGPHPGVFRMGGWRFYLRPNLNEVANNGLTGQPLMLPKTYSYSIDWLDRRLMSAIGRNNLRDVKAFLALGACPNRPSPCEPDCLVVPNNRALSVTLPLVLALEPVSKKDDAIIAKALLAAGADAALCLYWLSRTASPPLQRIVNGLLLCEIIHQSPWQASYNQIIEAWLADVSTKINNQPEPAVMDSNIYINNIKIREYHVLVHKRLMRVSADYGLQHKPVAWVTAELL